MMTLLWYQWMALCALGICIATLLFYFARLVKAGKPDDLSHPSGSPAKGIRFAFTGAMSPARKESAYLHLPTYAAGLLFHMGNFLSFFLFFLIIAGNYPSGWISIFIIIFLSVSSASGMGILIKRIVKNELRSISNPDDFLSNILVTLFEIMTLIVLMTLTVLPSYRPTVLSSFTSEILIAYYLTFTLLALYIPVGKLRHTVYFFAARYHLGYFFGRRGVWPVNNLKD